MHLVVALEQRIDVGEGVLVAELLVMLGVFFGRLDLFVDDEVLFLLERPNSGQNFAASSAVSVSPLAMMSARFAMRSLRNCATICSSVIGGGCAAGAGSADHASGAKAKATANKNLVFIRNLHS
jgi:hypothetical protein